MPSFADATSKVTPLYKKRPKLERNWVAFSEFEPYYNQLRTSTNASQDECLRLIGYAGGSHLGEWRKSNSVPALAINAIRWILHEMQIPQPDKPANEPTVTFEFDELADLFAAVRGLPVSDEARKALVRKIAKGM